MTQNSCNRDFSKRASAILSPVHMNKSSSRNSVTRRSFLAHSAAVVAAAGLAEWSGVSSRVSAATWPSARGRLLSQGQVILFQGDSITDAGRKRDSTPVANDQPSLGNGYAWLAAAELLV